MSRYDPWEALGQLDQVRLERADLPSGQRGRIHFSSCTITLGRQLLDVEQRCTLAHELVHLERGPVIRRLVRREERAVSAIAARRLVPMSALRTAIRSGCPGDELAEELGVDVRTVQVRLRTLTEVERSELSSLSTIAEGAWSW
jgi:Zn-dependent peptidase ImmA (M78 family)